MFGCMTFGDDVCCGVWLVFRGLWRIVCCLANFRMIFVRLKWINTLEHLCYAVFADWYRWYPCWFLIVWTARIDHTCLTRTSVLICKHVGWALDVGWFCSWAVGVQQILANWKSFGWTVELLNPEKNMYFAWFSNDSYGFVVDRRVSP